MSWLTLKQIRARESRLAPGFSPFGFLTQIDCAFVATPILNALVRINVWHGSRHPRPTPGAESAERDVRVPRCGSHRFPRRYA